MSSDEKSSHSPDSVESLNTGDSSKKHLKPRTNFTPLQLCYLEEKFQENEFPKLFMRKEIANHLNLTTHNVQVWFQNRRAKNKRKRKQFASVEHMKHTPTPPSFWPQNLPFTSNFTEIMHANKNEKEGKQPHSKPCSSEPSSVTSSSPGPPTKSANVSNSSDLDKRLQVNHSSNGLACVSETADEDSNQANSSLESDSTSSCSESVFCRSSSASSVASQSTQSLIVSYKIPQLVMPPSKTKIPDSNGVATGMLEKVDAEIRKYETNDASIIFQLTSQSLCKTLDYTHESAPSLLPETAYSVKQKRSCSTGCNQLINPSPPLVSPKSFNAASWCSADKMSTAYSSSISTKSPARRSSHNGVFEERLESISKTALLLMSKKRLKDKARLSSQGQGPSNGTLARLLSSSSSQGERLSASVPLLPTYHYEHTVELHEQNLPSFSHSSNFTKSDSYLPSASFSGVKQEMLNPLSTPLSASNAGMEDIFSLDLFNSSNDPNFGLQSPIFAEDPIALSDILGEEQWHTIHCAALMQKDRVQPSMSAPLNPTIDYYPDVMLHADYQSQKLQDSRDLPLIAAQASCIDVQRPVVPPVTAPPPYQAALNCVPLQSAPHINHMTGPPLMPFTTKENHLNSSLFFS